MRFRTWVQSCWIIAKFDFMNAGSMYVVFIVKFIETWWVFLKGKKVRLWTVNMNFTINNWNSFRMWVFSVWADQDRLQEWANINLGCESLSSFWADQNHWQEWMNTYSGCESVFSVWADQNHWQEWMNSHPACEFLASVWADLNYWCEWVNTYPGCELVFSVWADQIHWWHWVNTCPGCELLSTVWTDQIHWQEWVNICLVWECESSLVFEGIYKLLVLTRIMNMQPACGSLSSD